jgi:hypothetical protein
VNSLTSSGTVKFSRRTLQYEVNHSVSQVASFSQSMKGRNENIQGDAKKHKSLSGTPNILHVTIKQFQISCHHSGHAFHKFKPTALFVHTSTLHTYSKHSCNLSGHVDWNSNVTLCHPLILNENKTIGKRDWRQLIHVEVRTTNFPATSSSKIHYYEQRILRSKLS